MLINSIRTLAVGVFISICMIGPDGGEGSRFDTATEVVERTACWACWK